ncbi:SDR family oxidoreductase [Cyanobacterium aponinum UTEX 3221]|uniref:SDR family oxidoreductase n=1 Tax=Cyanobacterium aponinum TaxID=379064 RepID=UPI002B4C0392|nr:SDR family oxidoreductase [Cyanobacterium aponinum]WRL39134.1 SDR family oxidoreductase [Cyanobacterium aponinum UTEX 3221]
MENAPNRLRAIITGASSGIGKATTLAFASSGIDLCLVSRDQAKLQQVADLASEYGGQVKIVSTDLANLSTVQTVIKSIAEDFGPIDILVNNAGMGYTNLLKDTSLKDWQKVLDLNLTSVFQCVMGILPYMRERGKGTIVNVASIAASNFFPEWGLYSVSKSALVTFGECLAIEERANGIRVTTISPGAVNTPIWETETVQANFDKSAMLTPETVAQTILHTVLLPQGAVVEKLTIAPSGGSL